jgi:hypothetical protein
MKFQLILLRTRTPGEHAGGNAGCKPGNRVRPGLRGTYSITRDGIRWSSAASLFTIAGSHDAGSHDEGSHDEGSHMIRDH